MVIKVLLNDACTWAIPSLTVRRIRFFVRTFALAMVVGIPALSLDGPARALSGAGVGVGPLASNRQSTPMPNPAVAPKIHQSLDVHRHLTTQVTFRNALCDFAAQRVKLSVCQVPYRHVRTDTGRLAYLECACPTDTIYVRQGNPYMLPVRNIDSSNTCHSDSFPLLGQGQGCRCPPSVNLASACVVHPCRLPARFPCAE